MEAKGIEKFKREAEEKFGSMYRLAKAVDIPPPQFYSDAAARSISLKTALKLIRAGMSWDAVKEVVRPRFAEFVDEVIKCYNRE